MEEDIGRQEVDWEYEAAKNKWERILEGLPEKEDSFGGESSFRNGTETELALPMLSSDTNMSVMSSEGFPTTPFKVLVGTEEIWVTKKTGIHWECMRGVGETIVSKHDAGDRVTCTRVEGSYAYKRPGD